MKKEIGKNQSSGAEKVERIERETAADVNSRIAPDETKKDHSMSEGKPQKSTKSSAKKPVRKEAALREKKAAAQRVNTAKARAEKKKKKAEEKASYKEKKLEKKRAVKEKKLARKEMIARKKADRIAAKEKRRADLKAKRVEKKAEARARREMLKNESKAERQKRILREKRERIAAKRSAAEAKEKARENRRKARETARARRAQERREKREERASRRTPGFGGWLAAVISLGTACLILATVVTAGAFRMNDMDLTVENGYRSALYEMVSVSEELDDNLGKLRVASGTDEQRKLLTNILVDSALLESALEKVPVETATGADLSSFVNRTNSYARTMLKKLDSGAPLSGEERESLASLYETNGRMHTALNTLINAMTEGDLKDFAAGKETGMNEKLGELGRGMRGDDDLLDAPFSEEGNLGENRLSRFEEITASEAEERVRAYFRSYHVRDVNYTGETSAKGVMCYNFVLVDENDVEIYAQISKRGGKLVFFNTYEECTQKNFDLEACDAIARKFLKEIGIGNVEAVWLSDGGMVANLTYTTVEEHVRIYPELIRIRVCEEKGRVIGMDANNYLVNDKEYDLSHRITRDEARGRLSADLEVLSGTLALIPIDGEEVLAYEFHCKTGDEEYLIYIDANSGKEVEIFRVRESARGSYLR